MGIVICDRIIMFFLGLLIFFLPISKAVIEISASVCIVAWIIKRIIILRTGSENNLLVKCKLFFLNLTSLNKALILFFSANLIALVFSTNVLLSCNAVFSKLLEYILIFIIVRDTVNSRMRYKALIWVMLASLFFIGMDGIFQIITGYDLFRHRELFIYRVTAAFENPNTLGSYLVTVIPVILSLIFINFNKKIKVGLVVAAVVVLATLTFTASKGAWLAFLPSLIFFGIYTKKRYILFIILGIAVIALMIPLFFEFSIVNLLQRLTFCSDDPGILDRKFLWGAAVRMFKHSPFFGVGPGTFMENYQIFWLQPTTEISYAHNCYLQSLAETGIIGLGAFILFLSIWFRKTLRVLSGCSFKKRKGRERSLSDSASGSFQDKFVYITFLGLSTGIIAYLLNSLVDTNFYSLPIAMLFWFVLGLQQSAVKFIGNE